MTDVVHVATRSDVPAIVFGSRRVSYAEFGARVDSLARHLISIGVGPDVAVAVAIPRSVELLVAVHGVVAAGGHYVPLDIDAPHDRTRYMLETAGARLALVTADSAVELPADVTAVVVDTTTEIDLATPPVTDDERRAPLQSADAAYTLFTSGSTGRPKGVTVSHSAIVNRLEWMRDWYSIKDSDVFVQKTPVTFDVSVWELFLPFAVGATLVVAEPERHGDPRYLAEVITAEKVSVIHFVPSMLSVFLDVLGDRVSDLSSLRLTFTSGEALTAPVAQALVAALPHNEVHNLYGPTEAAVDVTAHQVRAGETSVPIGVPVPSTTTFVLDSRLQLVPSGVPGELYLGGVQLARGYASQPALTAERFVASPFAAPARGDAAGSADGFGEPGERLYRTGDLVRWNARGQLEYLGRTDFQVKLRGQRLELGEVESVLMSAPGVLHAAATVAKVSGQSHLVAYVSPASVDVDAVKSVVAQALPAYMRPTVWMTMEHLPLNSAGKVARRQLPVPELTVEEFAAPESDAETSIAAIVADVLGVDRVSVTQSFFDLGGNSLSAARVAARVADLLDVDVSVGDLFDAPSVRDLAGLVSGRGRSVPRVAAMPRPARLPLSTAQSRMWFINQFDTASPAYNIPMALRLTGTLDLDALEAAVGDVVANHEILRTTYPSDEHGPLQLVTDPDTARARLDWRAADTEEDLFVSATTGFDVATDPPLRVRYLRRDETVVDVVVTVHHIAFDGESTPVFVRDLLGAYLHRTNGAPAVAAPAVQYADFALWQREYLGAADDPGTPMGRQLAHWRTVLADLPAVTDLPMDRPRPAVLDTAAAVESVTVDDALATALDDLARSRDVTLFMVLHAALAVTVARLASTRDVVIGTPIAGRPDAALHDLVGMFVNTLVLRTAVDPASTTDDLIATIRAADLDAFAHADVQFDDLIEELAPERSTAYPPLVQIAYTLVAAGGRPEEIDRVELSGLSAEPLGVASPIAKFDLTVSVSERTGSSPMRADFLYATSLFDAATIRRFTEVWLQVIAAMATGPALPIGDIDIVGIDAATLSAPSRNSVGEAVPAADGGVTEPLTLTELLSRRDLDPHRPALVHDGAEVSYAEFEERTNRLARQLISRGVGPGDVVAVGLERSIGSVVAVFGVIKAGAAYVPIDPAYPSDRIAFMVSDSGVRLGLTDASTRSRLGESSCEWLELASLDDPAVPGGPVTDAERRGPVRLDDLAYLVYTSGSTGRPKAVGVPHRGIANFVAALTEVTGTPAQAPDTRVLHVASPSFDASVLEMMWSIAVGHTLVVAPASEYAGDALGRILERDRVTDTLITPTVLATVDPRRGRFVRNLVTGGEACPPELIARWATPESTRRMFNFYGPSEATVWATTGRSEPGAPVTIGRPVRGFAAYVLDGRLHPVPQGVVGELYLSTGDSLARGYLGRPGLTASSFVADPFAREPGRRMYATGDLVRITAAGEIEFAGRADHQVKINGQRVELGEIESVLGDQPGVGSVVVTGVDDEHGRTRLVAYLVGDGTAGDGRLDADAVLAGASDRLAGHMIPHSAMVLDELPVTPGGKLDRRALPVPEFTTPADGYVAPATTAEETLAAIVAGLLGLDTVSVTESFFALGGDSIMSIQLASAAKAAGLPLSPREIFEQKTIRAMARVASAGGDRAPMLAEPAGEPAGRVDLPPIVSWLVDAARTPADFADFNQSMVLTAPPGLTVEHLGEVLGAVVAAHPMLGARLESVGDTWILTAGTPFDADASIVASTTGAAAGEPGFAEALVEAHAEAARRLDPAAGRLVAATIVTGAAPADSDHAESSRPARIVLVLHHLGVDAVSWPILIEDLLTVHAQLTAGQPVAVRAEETSQRAWQRALTSQLGARRAEAGYWLDRSPVAPTDFGAALEPDRDRYGTLTSIVHRVDPAIVDPLTTTVPEAFSSSVVDVLLATLARAVRSWQRDRGIADTAPVTVLTEGHGRYEDVLLAGPEPRRADLSRTVGWFTSLAPLAIDPADDVVHAVKAAKEERLGMPDSGIGYGLLRYAAGDDTTDDAAAQLHSRPLPTIAFNYLGTRGTTGRSESPTTPDVAAAPGTPFLPAPDAPFLPATVSDGVAAMSVLTVNASTGASPAGRVLSADLQFPAAILSPADVGDIAQRWTAELADIVRLVADGVDVGLSPADVPGAEVTQHDLDTVAERFPGAAVWALSPLQRGLYFQSQLAGTDQLDVYVTQAVLHLDGDVDLERLRTAVVALLDHHRALKSGFVRVPSGHVVTVVPETVPLRWRVIDVPATDAEGLRAAVHEVSATERTEPFDLADPPLLRAVVVRHAQGTSVVITNHHILFDGWSGPLVLADLLALYATGSPFTGRGTGERTDFADYLARIADADLGAGLAAWTRILEPVDEPTLVAPGLTAASVEDDGNDTAAAHLPREHRWVLEPELVSGLERTARQSGSTMATALQLAWAVLLSRLTDNRVVTFGETVSGRPAGLDGVESMVGLFINTLPAVVDVDPDATIAEVLGRLQSDKTAVLDHQHIGLPEILTAVGRPQLFDTLTVHESYPVDNDSLADGAASAAVGLSIRDVEVSDATHYPLNLATSPTASGIAVRLTYLPDAFADDQVAVFARSLVRILRTIADDAQTRIADIPPMSADDEARLDTWSTGPELSPAGSHVADLLLERVAASPDAIAVVGPAGESTYAELGSRVSVLARRLVGLGVGPEVAVGVCIPRSVEMIVAVHAILVAGGQFVPMDPAAPADRIDYLARTADVAAVLIGPGQTPVGIEALDPGVPVVTVDDDTDGSAPLFGSAERASAVDGANPAYTIFTSGSTGRPKGVTVSHETLRAHLDYDRGAYDFGPDDVFLQVLELTFDPSVGEILRPLLSGGRLVVMEPGAHRDPVTVLRYLADFGVTSATLVPSMLAVLTEVADPEQLRGLSRLRFLHTGGEALPQSVAETVRELIPHAPIHNQYGPTEATIYATVARVSGDSVSIGRPVANTTALVLDHRLRPVAPGFTGELYLGGIQLARGYTSRPALTAERFVPNPYGEPGSRLYRTGDLVRWRADGELEYQGRTDFQVKLRGQRIELGEIESALTSAPGVVYAAAAVVETPAGQQLVAYLTPASVDLDTVKHSVAQALPEFMRPGMWMLLDEMPLSSAGKVVRQQLPAPTVDAAAIVPLVGARETTVAAVFAELLSMSQENVGATTNFFEIGGNSLSAMRAAARIGDALGADVTVRDVFEAPTPRLLAERLGDRTGGLPPIVAVSPRPDRIPLSYAQQRMWFINRFDPTLAAYNIPAVMRLTGALDPAALGAAIADVVARHEILRTTYPEAGGRPVQSIAPVSDIPGRLDHEFVPAVDDRDGGEVVLSAVTAGFDLTVDWPVRTRLIEVGNDSGTTEYILAVVLHHVASDGESLGPLVSDLTTAYLARAAGAPPRFEPLPVQYADYAIWQRRALGDVDDAESVMGAQLDYWAAQLAGMPDLLELPTDRPRPAVASQRGARVPFTIPADVTARIDTIADEFGVTPFMVLHAVLAILLADLSGTDDVAIGTPIAGRGAAVLDPLVGMFVNTLVLRTAHSGADTFADVLGRVRRVDLDAFAHADLPFETLVDRLNPVRSEAFAPLTQVWLTLDRSVVPELAGQTLSADLGGISVTALDAGEVPAKVDLLFSVAKAGSGESWSGALQYATDLFADSTAAGFTARFVNLLDALTATPTAPVAAAPILLPGEAESLVPVHGGEAADAVLLGELFTEAGTRYRRRTAVVDATGATLSYSALHARSNRLARWLIGRGVGPETLVALAIPRSVDLLVAIWAVAKTGGGYVPIDPDYPAERVATMVEDSGARMGLSVAGVGALPDEGFEWIRLDDASVLAELDATSDVTVEPVEPAGPVRIDNVAYVIYTSGSTGRPKGVAVSHSGLRNFAVAKSRAMGTEDGAVVLGFASPSFDASVLEYLLATINGGTLVYRPSTAVGGAELQEFMQRHEVATTFLTPSVLSTLDPAALPSLQAVSAGGEAVPQSVMDEWSSHTRIHNGYGPTETTIMIAVGEAATPGDPVRLGGPLPGVEFLVLDAHLRPVPVGVAGELYVLGPALSRGYLDKPDLTASRFVASPYAGSGRRMYRTGDVVRWRESRSGALTLEYSGRSDDQVKLRGLRIELGEIEAVLRSAPEVRSAVVVGVGASGTPSSVASSLAAYVVGDGVQVDALRDLLAAQLPAHMVPASITVLDEFPLTPVGKLDRAALPAPEVATVEFVAPATPVEQAIADAYAEILGVERVGATDSFFDLGGNSLSATRVAAALRDQNGFDIELAWLFNDPTVRGLARRLADGNSVSSDVVITLRGEGSRPPLFCVHPAGGLAWFYGGLAPHLRDRPIYGLQDPHVVTGEPSVTDARALARRYVEEIRRVQPSGPYHLLGWSVGGVIAHAMATHLVELGESVAYLGIMDSRPEDEPVIVGHERPSTDEDASGRVAESGAAPGSTVAETIEPDASTVVDVLGGWRDLFDLGDDVQASTSEEVTAIIRQQISGMGLLAEDQVERIMDSFDSSTQVVLDYRPDVFAGDMHVFTATEDKDDPSLLAGAWRPFVTGAIDNVDVATHHLGMANADALAVIGPTLDAQLSRIDATDGRGPE
ncbi:Non-ribosomal peptide synthetase modules-related protein [Gordonia terrae C-6]|uniref:Non-ribosomal peptide synthetase modules-related protein n=1 Tax=Gordonia terrae C-6 TaxID=1316928 RepID=R7YAY5_9ACTN|nr:non-ribosomal peptide synthetase [Gordonia terrae]EON33170.1 Non-ribosomal peptide synthetase modules-related protein [Gordonia terrae C-6]